MPKYRYSATDAAGKWVSGEIEGTTVEEAEARLLALGLAAQGLTEAEAQEGSATLSRADLVELVEQLGSLTRAGVPLPSGLRAAAHELVSPALKATFRDLASRLESGADLETALMAHGGKFSPELRGLILAGGRSGRLTDLLSEFVRSANLGSELRLLFWSTLLYPTVGLFIVLIIVRFVCLVSVETVDNLLNDFGIEKPVGVQLMAGLSRLMANHGLELILALLLVPLTIWGSIRWLNGPAKRRRILCGMPLIGPILRYCALTEFCHRLAMLLDASLPLPLAFELAGSSVGDAEVAEACLKMGRAVEEGEPLSEAVRLWDAIPAGLGQLFRWSEDQRRLPEALHLAGDMFEARARSQSNFARIVLSTALVILILWWVGFAVAALYLPLFNLMTRLTG